MPYDTGADKFAARRMRQFLLYVLVPSILFCGGGWYLVFGRSADEQSTILGGRAPTRTPPVVVTRIVSGDTVLGGAVQYSPPGSAATPKVAQVVASPTGVRMTCYARRDSRSPYADAVVYENGLFYAEAFTSVHGGMNWNSRYGWFPIADFACQKGI